MFTRARPPARTIAPRLPSALLHRAVPSAARTPEGRSPAWQVGVHDFATIAIYSGGRLGIQPKLIVGAAGDKYEQEADRAADRVMRLHAAYAGGIVPSALPWPLAVQRQSLVSPTPDDGNVVPQDQTSQAGSAGSDEDTAGAQGTVQPLRAGMGLDERGGSPSAAWERRLSSTLPAGRPLPEEVRRQMEPSFGATFAGVRVHDDAEAAGLSLAIGARAFTHHAHIYFGSGEFAPATEAGRRVLAHELTHVIQQRAAGPRGQRSQVLGASIPAAPRIQRLSRLNRTDPTNLLRGNYAPWGGTDPRGDEYQVSTDAGTGIPAWVAYSGYPENLRYWCHGHTFGTYARHGYSVYSGNPVTAVISDEWQSIADKDTKPGDITMAVSTFDHSAIFTNVTLAGTTFDDTATMLSTKNGQNALKTDSFAGVKAAYPKHTFQSFRKK
jgi:uncharacterized protein DUF4157